MAYGENNESRPYMVRVKLPHARYLEEKAKSNVNNPHNQIATEINALILADFEKAQRKSKQKK